MSKKHLGFREFIRQVKKRPPDWKDERELQRVIHKLPDFVEAVLLELTNGPLARQEILDFVTRMNIIGGGQHVKITKKTEIEQGLDKAVAAGLFLEKSGKISLTKQGQDMAAYLERTIKLFMRYALSERTSTFFTLVFHIFLSIVKTLFGLLSFSAGLLADAIDNTMDTLSAVGIWVGFRLKKEKAVALLIIIMMFFSLAGIIYVGADKIINPGPMKNAWTAFIVSAVCGLVMLMLSAYQYLVGKKTANFAILCQAVDSRNHVLTSLLVCAGILITFFAQSLNSEWLYYADAGVSLVIGFLILKSAVGLIREYIKPPEDSKRVIHFMGKGIKHAQQKALLLWLKSKPKDSTYSKKELLELFKEDFIKRVPKLLRIINVDFNNISTADFREHVKEFIELKVIEQLGGKYSLTVNLAKIKCRRIRRHLKT
ncbi:MAG: cation transporter [Spirochaetales bacterium]|nr:cation transporter [Spirochaetales bacterium]